MTDQPGPRVELVPGHTPDRVETVRTLFREYAAALGFDLDFQDFGHELAMLPGDYAPPAGRLLLATRGPEPAGCVALRRLGERNCEMKRLYVRPDVRGLGIGRRLAESVIQAAKEQGYHAMLLDTVPGMTEALALYESLGFQDTEPYRLSPIPGARFLRLEL